MMCLWVILIVSVAAHWAERGKDTTAIWEAAFAKEQFVLEEGALSESLLLSIADSPEF